MNKKLMVILTFILMITVGLGTCFHVGAAENQKPPYNPLSIDFDWTPDPGYYGEAMTFTATVTGGNPPYDFTWNMGDGTNYYIYDDWDGICNIEHTYYPTYSPTIYDASVSVQDNSDPSYFKGRNHNVEVRIDYDVHVLDIDLDNRVYTIFEDITGDAYIKNRGNHMCPYYTIEIWILGFYNWHIEVTKYNLAAGEIDTIPFALDNPGSRLLPYQVKVEITDPGYYDETPNDHWDLSELFWVV